MLVVIGVFFVIVRNSKMKKTNPEVFTLNDLMIELEEENEYIRRITQNDKIIIVETGYNCSGNALN